MNNRRKGAKGRRPNPKSPGSRLRRRAKRNGGQRISFGKVLVMPQSFPDTVITTLRYQDTIMNRNNVGGLVASWRYRINSAFDPDPLLGTGALSGFAEWATIYTHYRITNFRYNIQIANNETFPLMVACAPTLTDLGANTSNLDQVPELPYGKKSLLSAKGGADKTSIRGSISVAKLEGSTEPFTDSSFASVVTTNPVMVRFFNIGFTGGSTPLVNGVFVSIRLSYRAQFYARVPIFA